MKIKYIKYAMFIGAMACQTDRTSTPVVDSADSRVVECAQDAPHGEYFMNFEVVDSTCGAMGNIQADLFRGIVVPQQLAGCSLTYSLWNDATCTTESYFACDDDYWNMYLGWDVIADPIDADRFEGILFTEMVRFTGWSCKGSYSFEGLRKNEGR